MVVVKATITHPEKPYILFAKYIGAMASPRLGYFLSSINMKSGKWLVQNKSVT